MRPNILATKLKAGEVVLGLSRMYPAPGMIEGMGRGWDYIWLDCQHGETSYDSCLHAMWAAGSMGLEVLLRVPGHEPGLMAPLADLAPSAIMVPMVNTAEQAGDIVEALKFPPLGNRSYGGRRAIDLDGRDFYKERQQLIVAQTETVEAVYNAAQIIATEGIDGLFFGPDDMKAQMGLPINTAITDHKDLRTAMEKTAKAARAAGKFCGCVTPNTATVKMATEMGYQLLAGGGDITFLRVAAADRLTELRNAVGSKAAESAKAKQGSGLYGG